MRHYSARQRTTDGRWDYCCGNMPVGYCCEYRPIPEDAKYLPSETIRQHNEKMEPLASKFHTTGHATEKEACECYKQYLLDTALTLRPQELENATQQHHCQVCKKWTACYAMVGAYQLFNLCPEHQTREEVEKLFAVGESWES